MAKVYLCCAALLAASAGARSLPAPPKSALDGARAGAAARRTKAAAALPVAGGARGKAAGAVRGGPPSYAWAVLHNWLYFLSLGLCIPVLPRVIAAAVNEDGSTRVTPASARVGGDVEGLDKLLTFFFVGSLGALSDAVGRTPLIAVAALGYGGAVALQCRATEVAHFYAADAIDGLTSCMNAVCAAYVADATAAQPSAARAAALGVFQGLSTGGAFCVGFPLSAALSKGGAIRRPMRLAAALQVLNAGLALTVTPESRERGRAFSAKDANPAASLSRLDLFTGRPSLLRAAALAFGLVWLGNLALNATFVNYVNAKFGWGPKEAGPLLVLVGLTLAVVPRLVVPRVGVEAAIKGGCLVYALGFLLAARASTPSGFVGAVAVCGAGAVAVPALTALVAAQAPADARGAVLGGLQTLQELASAVGFPLYGRLLARGLEPGSAVGPGAPFLAAAAFMVLGAAHAARSF